MHKLERHHAPQKARKKVGKSEWKCRLFVEYNSGDEIWKQMNAFDKCVSNLTNWTIPNCIKHTPVK